VGEWRNLFSLWIRRDDAGIQTGAERFLPSLALRAE